MMEASSSLEEIKKSWKGLSKDDLKKDVSAGDIQVIVRQKSKSELSKIKRKLLIETVISALLLPAYLFYIHKINIGLAYLTDIFLISLIAALSWPTINILKIGKFQNQETIVFLKKFVFRFEKVTKTSVISFLTLFPAFVVASFILGFVQGYQSQNIARPLNLNVIQGLDSPGFTIGIIVLGLLLIISTFLFLIKLYYMFMYGKHVKNLKSFLIELEKQDV